MDCGIPFCHQGCPVNNQIPDWNNLVYRDQWRAALDNLHSTNNFPEFTGRVCPAPCEAACTLNIDDNPVTIKTIECQIVDRGWEEGWIQPVIAPSKTGKRVAVVGSGPAGMACAQQLARAGHAVTLFEKNDRIGGLLRYGIPDFKMEKHLIDRRIRQMEAEGVVFRTGVEVGVDVSVEHAAGRLRRGGAVGRRRSAARPARARPRAATASISPWISSPSRTSAVPATTKQAPRPTARISAKGKHVVVIGGGDTGSDCIGTSNRQGALSVTQLEIMPQPPAQGEQAADLARLAAEAAHLVVAGRRLRARLRRC